MHVIKTMLHDRSGGTTLIMVTVTTKGAQAMRKDIICALALLVTVLLAYSEGALAHEKYEQTVTVASLNVFHGIDCVPVRGEQCRLSDRIDLLFAHIVALGCPDIITLQEIIDRPFVVLLIQGEPVTFGPLTSALELIQAKLKSLTEVCGFEYTLLYHPVPDTLFEGTDEELILSRYPIRQAEIRLLHSALFPPTLPALQFFARHVLFARIDHPVGPIDVFTTHLASSDDFGDNACNSLLDFGNGIVVVVPCPTECDPLQTVRACEARQVARFVEERHDVLTPAFITGDFNAPPSSLSYQEFTGRGWIDSHLAAGKRECKPHTGVGCTAGRVAVRLDGSSELEEPARNVDERIDYILVVPPTPEAECTVQKRGTGIFAGKPNPFIAEPTQCGPLPNSICWPSDHNGTMAHLRCDAEAKSYAVRIP
jgi:endonuclease/exonuclease/phosphatase family metal-dependent hydrolase